MAVFGPTSRHGKQPWRANCGFRRNPFWEVSRSHLLMQRLVENCFGVCFSMSFFLVPYYCFTVCYRYTCCRSYYRYLKIHIVGKKTEYPPDGILNSAGWIGIWLEFIRENFMKPKCTCKTYDHTISLRQFNTGAHRCLLHVGEALTTLPKV